MENIINVRDNKRHTKRKMYDALGNDLIKILTELITNSDDSYRRKMAKDHLPKNVSKKNVININIFKKEKKIEVVDFAEGMSDKDIFKNFESYGADKSGRGLGYKTRGLFGQGASDVLFTQKESKIISIKENEIVLASFYWKDDERQISISKDLDIKKIREKYNILENGTIVSFVLNEKTKMPKNLSSKLSQFYMLRFIMSDKDKFLHLRSFNDKKNLKEERLHYFFPLEDENDFLYQDKISFIFEGKRVVGELRINKINDKNKKNEKYGDLKILVFDNENNIYDNTFFSLGERYPGVENLFGYLKLENTAEIIREKLNIEIPEEILTDSRDGLNKKHLFFKRLSSVVDPILESQADKINKNSKSFIRSDNFKEHKKMFRELNDYLSEELDEINETGSSIGSNPPIDGFEFIRDRIKITVGKKYSLKLLINPSVISSGTEIKFKQEDDNIDVTPESIVVDYDNNNVDSIIFYNLIISGHKKTDSDVFIEAKIDNSIFSKKVFVSVVEEDIYYPKYGMEFKPNNLTTVPNNNSKLGLYIDINKYSIGSEIKIISTNPKIEVLSERVILEKNHLIFENIAKVNVLFRSSQVNVSGKIIANCNNYLTEASVSVINSEDKNEGKSGLINGWDVSDNPEADWQKYFHPKTGKIIINIGNFINKYYFGDDFNQEKIEKDRMCQRYLSDLISDEVARFMIKKQIDKGHIGREYEEAVENHQRNKNKIAKIVYKFIVK